MNWSHDVFTHRETRLRENSHHFFQIIGKLRSREEKSKCISGYIYKKKETRGKDAVASPSFEKILKNCLESFWCWWKKETMRIRLRLTQVFPLFLSLPSPLIPLVCLPSFFFLSSSSDNKLRFDETKSCIPLKNSGIVTSSTLWKRKKWHNKHRNHKDFWKHKKGCSVTSTNIVFFHFHKLFISWELIPPQLVRRLCDWLKIIPNTFLTNHESRILLHLAQVNHLDLELLLVLVFIIIFFDWSTILVEHFKTFSNKNYLLTPLPDRWTVQAPRVELCCWYSRTMDTDTLFLRHPHWNIVPYAWLFSPWPQRIGRILASSRYASCDRSCWHGLPSSGPPGCKGGLARHHSRTFCRGIAITRSTAGQKRL